MGTVEKPCLNEYILGIGLGEMTQCDKPAEPTGVSHTQTECKGTQLSVGSQTTKMLRQQAKTKKTSGSEHQYFISRRSSKIISDADSVTCSGQALTEPQLGTSNQLIVDCSRAGVNVLFVGVLGPEGQEQVLIKHKENNKFLVEFKMKDEGKHILYIKWGEQNVPGSPFLLQV